MATNIPAKLRSADITRFQQRAAQLEKLKPAVVECKAYTTDLVDKLEQVGTERSEL